MAVLTVPVCPKCGADAPDAVVGEKHTCTFCGAIAVVEPPVPVVHQTIVQREVVQRVVTVDATTGRTSLLCPRCDVALFEGQSGATVLHGCATCGGVWLDNQASRQIVNAIPPGIIDMTERAARAAAEATASPSIDVSKAARCPFDRNDLARANVKGVMIDACPTHGTWFDAGEVTLLSHAFERARQAHVGGAAYSYASAATEARSNLETLGSILSAFTRPSSR